MRVITMCIIGGMASLILGAASANSAGIIKDGLILHLDAGEQIKVGGTGTDNAVWKNLANQPESIAGDAVLHNFGANSSSGWTGSGTPNSPYALRFDGKKTYAVGPGNLELPELTIEAWAVVNGYTLRGATIIGNDFGIGGISLLIHPLTESPILLHGATFTPLSGEISTSEWHQIAVTVTENTARFYVDGTLQSTTQIKRKPQTGHYPGYQLGVARKPDNDFVEADGLIGALSIVRVYNRILTGAEINTNFIADSNRFSLKPHNASVEVISSMPIPSEPGIAAPPVRCMKWDYYYHPVVVSGTGTPGWPNGPRFAFDGYPSNISQPYARNFWRADAPSADKPAQLTVNYKKSVAVTRYVHYYDRTHPACAWKDVDIFASSDQENWKLIQTFRNLPPDYPQVLGIDQPVPARFYKIAVKSLADSAPFIASHELETYYGATIGNVSTSSPIQSESVNFTVNVVSPDTKMKGAFVKLIAPEGSIVGANKANLPYIEKNGTGTAVFNITPAISGQIPVKIEFYVGKFLIDQRMYTLRVEPKLAMTDISPNDCITVKAGNAVTISGRITNHGAANASSVKASWMGRSISIGDLAPGKSSELRINSIAKPGYSEGQLTLSASGITKSVVRKPVIVESTDVIRVGKSNLTASDKTLKLKIGAVSGKLSILVAGKPVLLTITGADTFASSVPDAMLLVKVITAKSGDTALECRIIPNDINPIDVHWLDLEMRFTVDNPKIMFRPHIDWYRVEDGPNWPNPANGHNSATRMLCIQTAKGTLSMVPSTDNMTWGFTKDNEMTIAFRIPLAPYDDANHDLWKPITQSPAQFTLTLPVKKGDWWDAYRYVVKDLFKFEQPRQWAIPVTQMHMLTSRYIMRPEVWSEKWQNVRSHPNMEFFYNFYGTTYTIPALYSYYLATDDITAKSRAEKVVDWLLNMQQTDGPAAGGWFSQYGEEGNPPQMVGRDQAFNRWICPHSTGTSAKTLEWYWEASGRKDSRVFDAAKRACDWLISIQRPDGAWNYAIDLDNKPVTDLSDAGQIWCTWALWKMWEYTGENKYKEAAVKSRDAFKKTFMDKHRYMGYWEDVSGAGGNVARSWEGYEPAIAALVFADMGEKELALEVAKDVATWSWTRVTSTRRYETSYGQTTEQSLCGPSQAQTPMVGVGLESVYGMTGDTFWQDFAGGMKAVNFCADPDFAYGMVATGGWDDPLTAVIGPPYENTRPFVTPNNSRGDEYGRGIWNAWCTDQFAWLSLQWLIMEGNLRAPEYVKIDQNTLKGTVLDTSGRIKMPEEKCDINGIDHYDINWVGYENDLRYALLVMNHKEKTSVAIRPHEAHIGVYTRDPKVFIGSKKSYKQMPMTKQGIQYMVDIPAGANAILIWDRIK
ncbi:MAG: LamG-like jellyroll fold domain-containing protein [Armatimonadota bacterium]